MVQPVFVIAPHWSGATTRLSKHVVEQDGFKNLPTRLSGNVDVKRVFKPLTPPALNVRKSLEINFKKAVL
jgi:hypothetical protein